MRQIVINVGFRFYSRYFAARQLAFQLNCNFPHRAFVFSPITSGNRRCRSLFNQPTPCHTPERCHWRRRLPVQLGGRHDRTRYGGLSMVAASCARSTHQHHSTRIRLVSNGDAFDRCQQRPQSIFRRRCRWRRRQAPERRIFVVGERGRSTAASSAPQPAASSRRMCCSAGGHQRTPERVYRRRRQHRVAHSSVVVVTVQLGDNRLQFNSDKPGGGRWRRRGGIVEPTRENRISIDEQ